MTDEELDAFFIETLKNILADAENCKNDVKDIHTPEYDEINAEYDEAINLLTSLLNDIKSLDDLAQKDEEVITSVYDYIAAWADNFVIAADNEQREKDFAEYEKLEEILDLFLDSDDSEDADYPDDTDDSCQAD